MRITFWVRRTIAATALALLAIADLAVADANGEETLAAGAHPGAADRRYLLHAPDRAPAAADVAPALVLVLHGCRQTHRDIAAASRFSEIADLNAADPEPRNDFVVAYPFVTQTPGWLDPPRSPNCWGWWLDAHRHEGAGEAADLARLIEHLIAETGADPGRVFVAGLSSGAAMAVAMGVSYAEKIAAVGAVAGLPFGETAAAVGIAWPYHHVWALWAGVDAACLASTARRPTAALVEAMAAAQTTPAERALTPLMAIHSEHDCTVPVENALALRDVWIARYGADGAPASDDCGVDGVACARTRYSGPAGPVVETVIYDGARGRNTHYWVGDGSGAPFTNPAGPSATCLLLDFFALAPPPGGPCAATLGRGR